LYYCIAETTTTEENLMDTNPSVSTQEQQNIQFLDTNQGTIKEFGPDMELSEYYGKMQKAELGDFLSRPVLINTTSWTGATLAGTVTTIKPFYEFFNNTYIKYKLNNYAFLRCKLKLKIMINASPFFYGSMLISYSPLEDLNPLITYSSGDAQSILMQRSQLPHLWIFPQNNQGGQITLPFLYHKDWIPISGTAGATALQQMGTLRFDVVNILKSANGAIGSGDSITIQTYAWAEDLDVSGPTIALALQGGEWESEGVVSKPASFISGVASKLVDVPVIGRFARAVSIGAGAVGNIAKLFGFTDVPVIKDAIPIVNKTTPDFATSEISYPINRLCLDPKNELSIDPGITGSDRYDQMTISYMTQHESLIGYGSWNITHAIDTLLFTSTVGPNLQRVESITGPPGFKSIIQTPISLASYPFKYWRGDIIFKFVIISSKFHKGWLRFTFDPTGNSTTNILNTTSNSTVTYTQIIDLSDQTEFEVRVPYHQALPFLKVGDNDWTPFVFNSTPSFDTAVGTYYNGLITLRVLTALTAPVDTSDCSFLVFVKGAENLEFSYPTGSDPSEATASWISHWEPQGSEYVVPHHDPLSDKYTGEDGNPSGKSQDRIQPRRTQVAAENYVKDQSMRRFQNRVHNSEGTLEISNSSCEIPVTMSGNVAGGDLPERYNVNFGERILSFRQLFHRKLKYRCIASDDGGANNYRNQVILDKHPVLPGYNSYGMDKVRNQGNTSDVSAVMSVITPLSLIAPAFIGYRGSLNYYIVPTNTNNALDGATHIEIKNYNGDSYTSEGVQSSYFATTANAIR